ncbi:hypothetical protein ABN763_16685 [Spongiivirga sp. MCCC 1A20706]|uniref:hypothetical protein n=1 Tax=Spongiivirga sp. MCCC 1A20706 TaxID=3160963 RepID=UPI003977D9C2
MKTIKTLLGLLIVLFFTSCSTVRVTDMWKEEGQVTIKNKRILVVSNTDSKLVRINFEEDMTCRLIDEGFDSVESYKLFPDLNTDEPLNKQEEDKLIKTVKDKGFDVVIQSKLIDEQEYQRVVQNTQTNSITRPIYYRYRGRLHVGFYDTFYTTSYPTQVKGTKYIMETVVYDLTKPKDQLVTIVNSEVHNPQTLKRTSKDFSKEVVKQLLE